jgi:hypothetical protein
MHFDDCPEITGYSFLSHLARRPFPVLMPLIHLEIGGRMCKFLLDTGSSMCLLPQHLLPKNTPIEKVSFKITGVSGKTITPVGKANIVVHLQSHKKQDTIPCAMQVCVFNELPIQGADGILGMDFLMHHGFSINLPKKKLVRWDNEICKIENLDVPAQTVYNLPTYITMANEIAGLPTQQEVENNSTTTTASQQGHEVSIQNCNPDKMRQIKGRRCKILSYQLPDRYRDKQIVLKSQSFAPGVYCEDGLHRVPANGIIEIVIYNYSNDTLELPRWHQVNIQQLRDEEMVMQFYDIEDEEKFLKAIDINLETTPWFKEQQLQRKAAARKRKRQRYKMQKRGQVYLAQPELIRSEQPPVDEKFENAIEEELQKTALSPEGRKILQNTLRSFRDVIRFKDEALGNAAIFEQDIPLNTKRVVRVPQFPLGQPQHEPMKEWVDSMLAYGIIRPSRSPYNSPCMMVPKPKGGWRMVIDFREINKYLPHDPYPLPDINRTLQELGRNGDLLNFITSIDLLWGFYHISIQEGDRQKTAFTTPQGRWEYIRLPMGMKTSPAAFQRLVDLVIMRNMDGNVFCYVDDVLCYSKTEEEHLKHLTKLFTILRKYGMKANMDKTLFARKEVAHLGHIVTSSGVKMDTSKLKKMRDLPTPKTPKQLKGLLGIASYYRRFVPDFAKIVRPLTNMLRKGTELIWGTKQQDAREKLTTALETADPLDYVVQGSTKIITIGYDEHTLSAMLSQERETENNKTEKPILFASKVMNEAEVRVKEEAKSLKAAKFAISQFRPYLHANKVIIRTNDRVLMQLQDKPTKDLTSAQAKWIAATADICPLFELKTTKTNEVINLLGDCWDQDVTQPLAEIIQSEVAKESKGTMPCVFPATNIIVPDNLYKCHQSKQDFDPHCAYIAPAFQYDQYEPILAGYEWVDLQNEDESVRDLKEKYDKGDPEILKHYFKDLTDVLFRIQNERILVVVPRRLRKRTIQMYHDTPRAGHYAIRRTFQALRAVVWWEGMEQDVTKYVHTCLICQYYKLKGGKAPHMPRSIPPYPFYTVSMDLVGPMSTTMRGNQYILVCQDAYSKWVEMIPLPDARVSTVADAFMKAMIVRYGPPMKILTDRGSQFTAALFSKMCAFLGVRSLLTTAYRPQCNGANERTHRELKRYLGMFTGIDGVESELKVPWDTLVRYAAWAYNTTYHSVLKMSPYEVLFNRPPNVHALGALGGEHRITERILRVFGTDELDEKVNRMSKEDAGILKLIQLDKETAGKLQKRVIENLEHAQQRWNKTPSSLIEDGPCFHSGEFVLLRNMRATSNTMLPKYTGPYEILRRLSPVTYEILRPEKWFTRTNGKDIVHIDRLKVFNDPEPGTPITPLFLQPEEEIEEEKEVKIVEVTRAGLQTIARMPPDTHIPVPMVAKHRINDLGQIVEDVEPIATAIEEAGLLKSSPQTDQIKIIAALPDQSADPGQTHFDHKGAFTRAKAKLLNVTLPKVGSVLRRWAAV